MKGGRLYALSALLCFAGVGSSSAAPPRLVTLIVVDQLAYRTLEEARPFLGKGGFERLRREGAWFSEARYSHLANLTAPGHACISTGAYASTHRIHNNHGVDRATGKKIRILADPAHKLINGSQGDGDSSPAALAAETVADALVRAHPGRSKAFSVSLKARSGMLLAGKAGRPYFYDESTGEMTSSTYYGSSVPAWVKAFNQKHAPSKRYGTMWHRRGPARAFTMPDDAPHEADLVGLGRTFPHPLTGGLDKPGVAFYVAYLATSLAVDAEAAFIRSLVEHEGLGKDDAPDLLAISFSSLDLTGHVFGPESQEARDVLLRVDAALAMLLPVLERAAGGRKNHVVALVADHGTAPSFGRLKAMGHFGGHLRNSELRARIDAAVSQQFGAGKWVMQSLVPDLYLDHALAASRKVDIDAVQRVAAQAAVGIPGIAAAFTHSDLSRRAVPPGKAADAALKSFHPEVSGDVVLALQPFWYTEPFDEPVFAASHGTPWDYDAHVPLAVMGPRITPGERTQPVDVAQLARTLAKLCEIDPPATAEGALLPLWSR